MQEIHFYQRSEEHTSELQSRPQLVCRLLLEKKKATATSSRRCAITATTSAASSPATSCSSPTPRRETASSPRPACSRSWFAKASLCPSSQWAVRSGRSQRCGRGRLRCSSTSRSRRRSRSISCPTCSRCLPTSSVSSATTVACSFAPRAFFFNDTATTEIYTLSLHDALPILNPIIKTRQTPATLHQLLFYTVKELFNIRSR